MKMFKFFIGLTLLAATGMMAQGPLYDKVQVNLPYPITVNKTVLPPGEYVIQEHESAAGGSRILHFFTDQGMKLETTAMAIPALDNRTPQQTKLVLEHFGSDYYLNKIWVQGKDYGYEFPIPADVRMLERERNIPSTVVGQYQPAPPPVVAETKPAPEPEPRTETAQAAPPPAPPVQAQPEPAPAPAPAAEPPRVQADQTPAPAPVMPATAANWLNLVVGGILLTGSGFALRRFQA
jgi:hypothetical protein